MLSFEGYFNFHILSHPALHLLTYTTVIEEERSGESPPPLKRRRKKVRLANPTSRQPIDGPKLLSDFVEAPSHPSNELPRKQVRTVQEISPPISCNPVGQGSVYRNGTALVVSRPITSAHAMQYDWRGGRQ
jgi:hypothetical protein